MFHKELIERSALRILEKSIHGGLRQGEIGIFTSRHGVGKTACLVQIALDELFQNKHVVHISFADRTNHIIDWYHNLYQTLCQEKHLFDMTLTYEDLVKNRVILHLSQRTDPNHVFTTLQALLSQGQFDLNTIILDGIDSEQPEFPSFLKGLRKFIQQKNITAWVGVNFHRETLSLDKNLIPQSLAAVKDILDVIVILEPEKQHINLRLLKDRSEYPGHILSLRVDSSSLLIQQS